MKKRAGNENGLVYSTGPVRQQPADPEEMVERNSGSVEVVFRIESKGRRGKMVTVLEMRGFHRKEIDRLAKELKSGCGTGGTVRGNHIELQGDQREAAAAVLREKSIRIRGQL